MKELLSFALLMAWIAGTVLVKGAWLTAAAVLFPPYAWYVVVEHVMRLAGWIA
jgi:hypothetical protein